MFDEKLLIKMILGALGMFTWVAIIMPKMPYQNNVVRSYSRNNAVRKKVK